MAMTKELQQLGGGNVRLGQTSVHCFVSKVVEGQASTLHTGPSGLSVREGSQANCNKKAFDVPHCLEPSECRNQLHESAGKVTVTI